MAVYESSQDERFRELRVEYGLNDTEIAEVVGCSRWMVTDHLKRMGVPPLPRGGGSHRWHKLPASEIERTRQLWERLGSFEAVAKELGTVTRAAVHGRLKRYGFLDSDNRYKIAQDDLRLAAQPLFDELQGRWRMGNDWDDSDLERMRQSAQKPTLTDVSIGTGFSERTIRDIFHGQRWVYPFEAERILQYFGLERRLLELYPEVASDRSAGGREAAV